jgi:hypothetical protein
MDNDYHFHGHQHNARQFLTGEFLTLLTVVTYVHKI